MREKHCMVEREGHGMRYRRAEYAGKQSWNDALNWCYDKKKWFHYVVVLFDQCYVFFNFKVKEHLGFKRLVGDLS